MFILGIIRSGQIHLMQNMVLLSVNIFEKHNNHCVVRVSRSLELVHGCKEPKMCAVSQVTAHVF
jgi:hypothetical protein